jgi:DNA polymerase-3 subunit gamma/tau
MAQADRAAQVEGAARGYGIGSEPVAPWGHGTDLANGPTPPNGGLARSNSGMGRASADEAPYDPDYDAPVEDPTYPGFDPGDEPADESIEGSVDGSVHDVPESAEERAVRLLAEAFGAEKIDEQHP